MNTPNPVKFELNTIINSLQVKTIDSLKEAIFKLSQNITIKDKEDSNLAIISNNFTKNTNVLTSFEKECRSIIIDKDSLDIICYTYDDILYDDDAKLYLANIYENDVPTDTEIQECFEGTIMALFFNNNTAYLSTRKCIDSKVSIWKSEKSYYDLFEDILMNKYNMNFEVFSNKLNKKYYYLFVLIHHENQNLVDYSDKFGENYKEIVLVSIHDSVTHVEIPLTTPIFENEEDIKSIYINIPNTYNDFTLLDDHNKEDDLNGIKCPLKIEGLLVKTNNSETNKIQLLKFHTNSYRMMDDLKVNNNNLYQGYIELYQKDKLSKYLTYFTEDAQIYNPLFSEEPYDTVGVIDAVFKVLTSELLELYKLLWDLKDNTHKNKALYDLLPKEYTTVLYKIRGAYFTKRDKSKNDNMNVMKQQHSYGLRIADIYNLLKNYDTYELIKLLRSRKIMKNLVDNECNQQSIKNDDPKIVSYQLFRNTSSQCDKKPLKMMAILLNRMFPEIEE
jgi:hypothetical protein